MIAAIDTNILIDILAGTPEQFAAASEAVQKLNQYGELVVPTVCYAELAGRFVKKSKLDDFVKLLGATVLSLEEESAFQAGRVFRDYLQRGGSRQRTLADFLIAAQAQLKTDRILTKDKRFYGMVFPRLKAITPTELLTPRSSK